jgi:hypothetical protein
MDVYEMSAQEIYEAFIEGMEPAEVLDMDRASIASQLMVGRGLDQEDAYQAADQMLAYAAKVVASQQP